MFELVSSSPRNRWYRSEQLQAYIRADLIRSGVWLYTGWLDCRPPVGMHSFMNQIKRLLIDARKQHPIEIRESVEVEPNQPCNNPPVAKIGSRG